MDFIDTDASRCRQELSNEYLIAKIGVDTAEIEPSKVWGMDRPFPKPRDSITAIFMMRVIMKTVMIILVRILGEPRELCSALR